MVNWHPLAICKRNIILDSHEIRYKSAIYFHIHIQNVPFVVEIPKFVGVLSGSICGKNTKDEGHVIRALHLPPYELMLLLMMLMLLLLPLFLQHLQWTKNLQRNILEKRNKHPLFQEKLIICLFIVCENYINIGHKTQYNLLSHNRTFFAYTLILLFNTAFESFCSTFSIFCSHKNSYKQI